MLSNIRAEREGDWSLHLITQVNMLPYFLWWIIPTTRIGGHCMHLRCLNPYQKIFWENFQKDNSQADPSNFKGVWSDMGVETSIIRDSKSHSGIIGLTRRGSAVLRWTCSRHVLRQYAERMRCRSGMKASTTSNCMSRQCQRWWPETNSTLSK